jgi:hypothetical protein
LAQVVHELLHLRHHHADVVIYNEPKAWLRTVWYESDLLFHYLMAIKDYKLFGAVIYSDLDTDFLRYFEANAEAISTLTGDSILIFTFGKAGSELSAAAEYICYRCVMETPHRLEQAKTPGELDQMRANEDRMLSNIVGRNRSILFAKRFGILARQTPCLVLWDSLESNQGLVIPFGHYEDNRSRTLAIKSLIDLIAESVSQNESSPLDFLTPRTSHIEFDNAEEAIGAIIRSFIGDHEP